jgi:hypothetical protein
MMKLKQPTVADGQVEAHGQQSGNENQGQNVNVKSGKEWRQNKQDDKNAHGRPEPLARNKLRYSFEHVFSLITRLI